ncbi:MAG: ABC transporter substrate-binding protein [Thermomicrobiales bacterium]
MRQQSPTSSSSAGFAMRVSRRQFLRRAGLLAGGLAALPLLAACGNNNATATTTSGGGGAGAGAGAAGTAVSAGTTSASSAMSAGTNTSSASSGAATGGAAPAQLKGAKLSLLMGSGFVKAADDMIPTLAKEWGKQVGAEMSVEIVNSNDLQARVASAIQSNSGPDIITCQNNWPWLYEGSFADVSSIADALPKKLGADYYDILVSQSKVNGVWHGVPMNITPNAIHWRTDYFKQNGYDKFPGTFDAWTPVGKKLKDFGKPYGAAAGHSYGDPKIMWYGVLWAFGGKEVEKDGKTVAINSPETQKALEWAGQFWKDACNEDGLSWDDSNNNSFYLSGAISATMNGSSIYLKAKTDNPDVAKNTDIFAFPKGPSGGSIINNTNTNAVTSYSKNQNAAKEFVAWLMDKPNFARWLEAGMGYNTGPTKNYESSKIWTEDPKMKGFLDAAQDSRWVGWPAPPSRNTSESEGKFIVVDMFARVFQGTAPKDSIAQAEAALKGVYK